MATREILAWLFATPFLVSVPALLFVLWRVSRRPIVDQYDPER